MFKLFTMHILLCLFLFPGLSEAGEKASLLCKNIFPTASANRFDLDASTRIFEWPLHDPVNFLSRWYKPLEKLSPENKELLKHIREEVQDWGLEIQSIKTLKGRFVMTLKESAVFVDQKNLQNPPWVSKQKQTLEAWKKKQMTFDVYYPSSREVYGNRDSMSERLTAKTLSKFKPGRYAFVLLQGEGILRIGYGHHIIGEGKPALAAGDIEIGIHPETQQNEILFLSPRSDTYRPPPGSLPAAVQALWENGIFPTHFELRNWDNEEVLISLSPN